MPLEADRVANPHPRIQRDAAGCCHVGPAPGSTARRSPDRHQAGSRMDQQAQTAQRRLALRRATRSSGNATRSRVAPSTNSPGCRMNGSSASASTRPGELRQVLLDVDEGPKALARMGTPGSCGPGAQVHRRRLHRTLVQRGTGPRSITAVRPLEADLANPHPRIQRDRQVGHVGHSRVNCPSKPGSTKPAVEWISRPRRPSDDLPSRRATRSSGNATRSRVAPSTNSPGCRMNGSSASASTRLVSSDKSCLTSIPACGCGTPGSCGPGASPPTKAAPHPRPAGRSNAAGVERLPDRRSDRITTLDPGFARSVR